MTRRGGASAVSGWGVVSEVGGRRQRSCERTGGLFTCSHHFPLALTADRRRYFEPASHHRAVRAQNIIKTFNFQPAPRGYRKGEFSGRARVVSPLSPPASGAASLADL